MLKTCKHLQSQLQLCRRFALARKATSAGPKKSLKHTHFGARKTNTEKAGTNNPWNACRSWDMRLPSQPERALARITAYRRRAPPADHASHYEERSRVLSPSPLKANTETSDGMCSTVTATPTNKAGLVSRGVATRLSHNRPLPRERMPGTLWDPRTAHIQVF